MLRYESELNKFIENRHPGVFEGIRTKKKFDEELEAALNQALTEFKDTFHA